MCGSPSPCRRGGGGEVSAPGYLSRLLVGGGERSSGAGAARARDYGPLPASPIRRAWMGEGRGDVPIRRAWMGEGRGDVPIRRTRTGEGGLRGAG